VLLRGHRVDGTLKAQTAFHGDDGWRPLHRTWWHVGQLLNGALFQRRRRGPDLGAGHYRTSPQIVATIGVERAPINGVRVQRRCGSHEVRLRQDGHGARRLLVATSCVVAAIARRTRRSWRTWREIRGRLARIAGTGAVCIAITGHCCEWDDNFQIPSANCESKRLWNENLGNCQRK